MQIVNDRAMFDMKALKEHDFLKQPSVGPRGLRYIHRNININPHIYSYSCMCTYMYACIHVCMCICMYAYTLCM